MHASRLNSDVSSNSDAASPAFPSQLRPVPEHLLQSLDNPRDASRKSCILIKPAYCRDPARVRATT